MARQYFVICSWTLEDAFPQTGMQVSAVTTDRKQAELFFRRAILGEMSRIRINHETWCNLKSKMQGFLSDTTWEVWEDGCYDNNHISVQLLEGDLMPEIVGDAGKEQAVFIYETLDDGVAEQCLVQRDSKQIFNISASLRTKINGCVGKPKQFSVLFLDGTEVPAYPASENKTSDYKFEL